MPAVGMPFVMGGITMGEAERALPLPPRARGINLDTDDMALNKSDQIIDEVHLDMNIYKVTVAMIQISQLA